MKIVITVMDNWGTAELSYKRMRDPETVMDFTGDIKIDVDKLYEALEKAKEAVKEE